MSQISGDQFNQIVALLIPRMQDSEERRTLVCRLHDFGARVRKKPSNLEPIVEVQLKSIEGGLHLEWGLSVTLDGQWV